MVDEVQDQVERELQEDQQSQDLLPEGVEDNGPTPEQQDEPNVDAKPLVTLSSSEEQQQLKQEGRVEGDLRSNDEDVQGDQLNMAVFPGTLKN